MEGTKMSVDEVMVQLDEWGSEKSRKYYADKGAGENLLLSLQKLEELASPISYDLWMDELVCNVVVKSPYADQWIRPWTKAPDEVIRRTLPM
ncbi:hypothetical protein [Paenibacillus dokdonensis]|uniref:hypothetical protein n=1 Tax=Paenibacillus dokdonensis TaxID=2567944 RepID=UPI0010A8BD6F|nr:hypothetical protein [Paenibacillus dokdonensis]